MLTRLTFVPSFFILSSTAGPWLNMERKFLTDGRPIVSSYSVLDSGSTSSELIPCRLIGSGFGLGGDTTGGVLWIGGGLWTGGRVFAGNQLLVTLCTGGWLRTGDCIRTACGDLTGSGLLTIWVGIGLTLTSVVTLGWSPKLFGRSGLSRCWDSKSLKLGAGRSPTGERRWRHMPSGLSSSASFVCVSSVRTCSSTSDTCTQDRRHYHTLQQQ